MRDLRPTTNVYWLLRQWRNRLHSEYLGRKLNLFWEERLAQRTHAIGKAIMAIRALEITEKAA